MNNRLVFYSVLIGCATLAPCHAAQKAGVAPAPAHSSKAAKASSMAVRIPGTEHVIRLGTRDSASRSAQPSPELLDAIVAWLAAEFQLPRESRHPTIRFETPTKIAIFRRSGIVPDDAREMAAVPKGQREVVAAYDHLSRTILLPEGWTGSTPAELSMLVHEMVHHLQDVARTPHECPEAREKLAYAAQEKWLNLFGRNLALDFEIDGLTLLASTTCMY